MPEYYEDPFSIENPINFPFIRLEDLPNLEVEKEIKEMIKEFESAFNSIYNED